MGTQYIREHTTTRLRYLLVVLAIGIGALGGLAPVSAQVPPIDDGTQEVVIQRGGTQVTTRVLREAPSPDNGRPSRPGSIIVKFRPGVSQAAQSDSHLRAGAAQLQAIGLPDTRRVQVPAGRTAQALAAYRARPDVEYAEPDYISHVSFQPNDSSFAQQWGLAKINAPAAWDVSQSLNGVRIAVLDCGIFSASSVWGDANGFPNGHPDIAPKVIAERDFTDSATGVDDFCNHGTHVAGTAAAVTNNATGVAGVAPNASVVNVKVCDDDGRCSSSAIAAGILWAAGCENGTCGGRRADVINMSFGGSGACSSARQAAINTAWSQGLVLVAAGGNDGLDEPNSPANCLNVISVASTTSTDARSSFSNFGAWVDVAAPGSGILSTDANGGYASFSGTSMATPHVAGLAALLWSTPHNTSNTALVQRILSTSNPAAVTGSVNGRIDAQAAVASGAAPAAPSNLSVGNPTANSLYVMFKDNATNETGIDIERKTGVGGAWAVAITTNPLPGASDGWWWQNTGLAAGVQYCYRLRARNGGTYSAHTGEVCASTSGGAEIPAAPSNLSLANPTASSLYVLFKDNATNETGIDIERKTGSGGTWTNAITTNTLPGASDGWWWQQTGLSAGTQYCFRLRARNGSSAFSAYTGEVCASTSGGPEAPAAPSNVSLANSTARSLYVLFKDNATNETGIDIERRTAPGGSWTVPITTNPLPGASDGWWWQDTGLAPSTQYCYRLRAKNGTSFSAYSNEACSTTVASVGSQGSSGAGSSAPATAAPATLTGFAPWRAAAPSR